MARWKLALIAFVLTLLVLACGEGPSVQPVEPTPTPNLQQVFETTQPRINELQTEVTQP